MAETVVLAKSPELAELYAKALKKQALIKFGIQKAAKTFPETSVVLHSVSVSRRRLEELNALTRGAGRDEIPASMMHILSFPPSVALMARDDFPVPLLGLVHLKNRVVMSEIISADAELDFTIRIANPAAHRSGTQFEVHAEARLAGQTGEPVWTGISTYLARGSKLGYAPVPEHEHAKFVAPDANALWQLPADIGRRYGAVSGDINPIHTSQLGAKLLGMKTTLAHGMYLAARALEAAKPADLDAFHWDVDFATPTFIPGQVALEISDTGGFQGWNPRNGNPNFSGSVRPLD